jgi:hypothetical protein
MRGPALHTLLVTLPDPTPNVAAVRAASARENGRSRARAGEPAASSPDDCSECGAPLREEGEGAPPHDGCPGCGERGPVEGVRVPEVAPRRQLPSGGYQVHNGRAARPVVVG